MFFQNIKDQQMNITIKEFAQKAGFSVRGGELYTSKLEHVPITEKLFITLLIGE